MAETAPIRRFLKDLNGKSSFTPEALMQDMDAGEVVVAVVDSGIDASHDALSGKVRTHFDASVEEPVPVLNPNGNNDAYGHGTGVAGIVAKLCPSARFLDVRVLGPGNEGTSAVLERGLRWALKSDAAIINLSLSTSFERIMPLMNAIEAGYFRKKLLVSSRRNLPLRDEGYPAALAVTVGVDNEGTLPPASASSDLHTLLRYKSGFSIEFMANGNRLPSLAPGNAYTEVTGTSFATPVVAGICAVLCARYPDADPFEIRIMLRLLAQSQSDIVNRRNALSAA